MAFILATKAVSRFEPGLFFVENLVQFFGIIWLIHQISFRLNWMYSGPRPFFGLQGRILAARSFGGTGAISSPRKWFHAVPV